MPKAELTFLEIIERIENGQPVHGIAGTGWRNGDKNEFSPTRAFITDLDDLASPYDYFPINYLLTSRGCPFHCTFCVSSSVWGRKTRRYSMDHVMGLIEKIVVKRKANQLRFYDETLTASRTRTLALCKYIVEKKLNFIWSCNTRVDSLNEELLHAMRLAGCKKIQLGVESGSPTILETIKKNIDPEKAKTISLMARKYGIEIGFYMIVGNRGESLETFTQSVQLIHDAQPFEFDFTYLQLLPGTEELEIYKQENNVTSDLFFAWDYHIFKYGFLDNVFGTVKENIQSWTKCYDKCLGSSFFSIKEAEEILERLDGLHSAHMDLAGAYLRAGQPDQAEPHVWAAFEKGYPLLDLIFNYLGIIAAFCGDFVTVESYLQRGANMNNNLYIVENHRRYRSWVELCKSGGKHELRLIANNNVGANQAWQELIVTASDLVDDTV